MTAKAALRARLRARLAGLPPEYIAASDADIFRQLIALPEYIRAGRIFAYCSVGREVDTRRFLCHALAQGKTLALPRITDVGVMAFYAIEHPDALIPGALGIPAPPDIGAPLTPEPGDLFLVPGLSFTRDGFRLGQGGGFYDRYLAVHAVRTAGLCRRRMLSNTLPLEEHDRKVSILVTDLAVQL